METHKAKRVEIIIEAALEPRLRQALSGAGATGYTVMPVLGGAGRSGEWSREGEISAAAGMVAVVCVTQEFRMDALLQAAHSAVERHMGVVTISDCEVLRPERY